MFTYMFKITQFIYVWALRSEQTALWQNIIYIIPNILSVTVKYPKEVWQSEAQGTKWSIWFKNLNAIPLGT